MSDLVVFPVFHPAAALYTPANRRVLEEDFAKLRASWSRGLPGGGGAAVGPEAADADEGCVAASGGSRDLDYVDGEALVRPRPAEQLPLW